MTSPMWSVSGRHWIRSGTVWAALFLTIAGLAATDDTSLSEDVASDVAEARHQLQSAPTQVAKVAVAPLDLGTLDPAAFGDNEPNAPAAK